MKFSAVILAGGQSRRMGCDKARIALHGKTLLATQVERVRMLAPTELFISGRADVDYSGLCCPVLVDAIPDGGPLAGILSALLTASTSHLLVLAVDMPLMKPELLANLVELSTQSAGIVPRTAGSVEPLAAVYPTESASLAERMLRHNLKSVRAFAENCVRRKLVRFQQINRSEWACFMNCNSRDQLPTGAVCPVACADSSNLLRKG
jgi:molybdopterin-guanine dinucleotide biosynthesis protein A